MQSRKPKNRGATVSVDGLSTAWIDLIDAVRAVIELNVDREELASRLGSLIDTIADDVARLRTEDAARVDRKLQMKIDKRFRNLFGLPMSKAPTARMKKQHEALMVRRGDVPTSRDWS